MLTRECSGPGLDLEEKKSLSDNNKNEVQL